eukprot:TRINITY_DN5769_c0_g1_i1.p1 TRINITY_DN5769_c0_g1~~TRINITY_DN5769_c0_g1_i1.p1  ORF type:complete len:674 (-),score=257.52 TRINITY_DN5769_c0_g1_i1:830-2851(-)
MGERSERGASSNILASASEKIKLWSIDSDSNEETASSSLISNVSLKEFQPHDSTSIINALAWNHSNHVIASGSSDGSIALSTFQGVLVQMLSAPAGQQTQVHSLSFSGGSRYLCYGSNDSLIRIWDLKKKSMVKSLKGHDGTVTCVRFSGSDSHIASTSSSGIVLVHSVFTGQTVFSYSTSADGTQGLRSLEFSTFRKSLFVGCSDDGSVYLWDFTSKSNSGLIHKFDKIHRAPANAVAFSPIHQYFLASVGLDKRIIFFDLEEKKVVRTIVTDSPLTTVSFMDDGARIAVGTTSGKIMIYDLRNNTNSPSQIIKAHSPSPVYCLAFSSDRSSKANSKSQTNNTIIPSTPSYSTSSKEKEWTTSESIISPPSQSKNVQISKETSFPSSRKNESEVDQLFTPVKPSFSTGTKRETSEQSKTISNLMNDRDFLFYSREPQESVRKPTTTNRGVSSAFEGGVFSPLASSKSSSVFTNQSSNLKHLAIQNLLRETEPKQPQRSSSVPSSTIPSAIPSSSLESNRNVSNTPVLQYQSEAKLELDLSPKMSPVKSKPPSSEDSNSKMNDSSPLLHRIPLSSPSVSSAHPITSTATISTSLSDLNSELLRKTVEDTISTFRSEIHEEIQNLHLEVLRQFQLQQESLSSLIQKAMNQQHLYDQIEELKMENQRLRSLYTNY